jgi:hypothetical protein
MTHSLSAIAGRVARSSRRWFFQCRQEFTHCTECDTAIHPWSSRCPNCGQANPAKVSSSMGMFLTLGIVLLTLTLYFLTIAF